MENKVSSILWSSQGKVILSCHTDSQGTIVYITVNSVQCLHFISAARQILADVSHVFRASSVLKDLIPFSKAGA